MVHKPVMINEILTIFGDIPAGFFIDATFGLGGHSKALRKKANSGLEFIGIDRDGEILEMAGIDRPPAGRLIKMNFADLPSMIASESISPLTGLLFDLGLNSAHLDDPSRGFSYQKKSVLDLRYDRNSGETAAVVIGRLDEEALIRILKEFGQERNARSIARAIKAEKPTTTDALAELIRRIAGPRNFNKTAARVFQALRIFINDELGALESALKGSIPFLAVGGRVAAISYHSLEDGIVKRVFALDSGKCFCGPEAAECVCGKRKILKVMTKKPVRPTPGEIESNPRARSARLRYAERIEEKAQ